MTHRDTTRSAPDRIAEFGVSVLRTVVPALWGSGAGWLADHGLHVDGSLAGVIQLGLIGAATAGWYAAWHWIEDRLPSWLTRLLLGANTPPSYRAVD